MKLLGVLLAVLILAMFTGCASTAQESAIVSPGVLSSSMSDVDRPDCPEDCVPVDCDVTCEELPDGTCLVTCSKDGEILCQQVCQPEECDIDCTTTCDESAPKECTPADCGS